jgi:hypothetical protein
VIIDNMAQFGLMECNGMGAERNRVEWNGMERNEINIPLHCLDKLKVSGGNGMILNSFHPIQFRSALFHHYFPNPNNGTLLYSIPLYSTNPNGA